MIIKRYLSTNFIVNIFYFSNVKGKRLQRILQEVATITVKLKMLRLIVITLAIIC